MLRIWGEVKQQVCRWLISDLNTKESEREYVLVT